MELGRSAGVERLRSQLQNDGQRKREYERWHDPDDPQQRVVRPQELPASHRVLVGTEGNHVAA